MADIKFSSLEKFVPNENFKKKSLRDLDFLLLPSQAGIFPPPSPRPLPFAGTTSRPVCGRKPWRCTRASTCAPAAVVKKFSIEITNLFCNPFLDQCKGLLSRKVGLREVDLPKMHSSGFGKGFNSRFMCFFVR